MKVLIYENQLETSEFWRELLSHSSSVIFILIIFLFKQEVCGLTPNR